MPHYGGFWSYVHADDEADGNRVTELARDIKAQFEMLTAETLDLFLDHEEIAWGDDWRRSIDDALDKGRFLCAILTPRYFRSPECRKELHTFAMRATSLGVRELLLPLLYVDVRDIHSDNPEDTLIALVKTFQWEDWRDLRFCDRASGEYRRAVAHLAERLVIAGEQAEQVQVAPGGEAEPSEDRPGLLDHIANAEEAVPKLSQTIEALSKEIVLIGEIAEGTTRELERSADSRSTYVSRVLPMKRMADRLEDPAQRIWSLANEYTSELYEVDGGIRVIISLASSQIESDPELRDQLSVFCGAVLSFAQSAREGLGSAEKLKTALAPIEGLTRDLRPVIRLLQKAFNVLTEAISVSDDWVQLIENTGIDCGEYVRELG